MFGAHRDLHVITLSFPTRRSSELREGGADVAEEGQTVAGQIPLVEDIAGGAYRHLQAGERLLAVGLGADAGHGGSVHGALSYLKPSFKDLAAAGAYSGRCGDRMCQPPLKEA